MSTPRLRFGLVLSDDFEVSADVPLAPFLSWFEGLQERNASARAEDRLHVESIRVRIACPCCGAGIIYLTSLEEDGAVRRACRVCHHRFDVEEPSGST